MHVTGDAESHPDSAPGPTDRDTIDKFLDPVLPDNPSPDLLRRDGKVTGRASNCSG